MSFHTPIQTLTVSRINSVVCIMGRKLVGAEGLTGNRIPFSLERGLNPSLVNLAVSVLSPSSWDIPDQNLGSPLKSTYVACFLLLYLVTVKWFCSSKHNSTATLNLNFLKAILVVLKS